MFVVTFVPIRLDGEKVLFVGAFCFDAFEFDVALLECGAL